MRGHSTQAEAIAAVAAIGAAVALLLLRKRRHAVMLRESLAASAAGTSSELPTTITSTETSTLPLVVVVGLGGVGSHAAHLLLRGGVRRMRLVDFDQVTLSSLNRHATAVRWDVGTPKATALKAALLRIAPDAIIEARVELFDDTSAARVLADRPAIVVDCIDDLATKAALLGHCVRLSLPVLCALGAGGKADACALHIGRLSEVFNDPIAASMLKRLRKQRQLAAATAAAAAAAATAPAEAQPVTEVDEIMSGSTPPADGASTAGGRGKSKPGRATGDVGDGDGGGVWWEEMAHQVSVVYSSEQQKVSLLPLPEGMQAGELGSQPHFRVRVLPVLPPLPAAVGAALASNALARLSGRAVAPAPRPVPTLSNQYLTKIHRKFVQHETKENKRPPAEVSVPPPLIPSRGATWLALSS